MGFRLFKRGDREIPADGWEITQELLQGVPTLDVIDKCLHGNPRTNKHRGAAHNFRIGMNR